MACPRHNNSNDTMENPVCVPYPKMAPFRPSAFGTLPHLGRLFTHPLVPPLAHPSTRQRFRLRWNTAMSSGTTSPLPSFRDVGTTSSPTHLSTEDWLDTTSDQQQAVQGTYALRWAAQMGNWREKREGIPGSSIGNPSHQYPPQLLLLDPQIIQELVDIALVRAPHLYEFLVQIGLCIHSLRRILHNDRIPMFLNSLFWMRLRVESGIFWVSKDFANLSFLSHWSYAARSSADTIVTGVGAALPPPGAVVVGAGVGKGSWSHQNGPKSLLLRQHPENGQRQWPNSSQWGRVSG